MNPLGNGGNFQVRSLAGAQNPQQGFRFPSFYLVSLRYRAVHIESGVAENFESFCKMILDKYKDEFKIFEEEIADGAQIAFLQAHGNFRRIDQNGAVQHVNNPNIKNLEDAQSILSFLPGEVTLSVVFSYSKPELMLVM